MKKIRVGVIGVGRGISFASIAPYVGMELVALCDTWEDRLKDAGEKFGVSIYTDYDKFLTHDMDAVVLANYCHEHAPFAVKALDSGMHVMSECIACKTVGEGVELARAFERNKKIYMFAENYAYFSYIQEMRRLYKSGEIGEIMYAEGEYNHPSDSRTMNLLSPGINHWRNHLPPTYYPTHAMSPIMHVTDTRPISINAQSIARSEQDLEKLHVRTCDPGAIILCRMNNGSVARLMGLTMRGHSIWYRFHGTRGLMENLRTGNTNMLRIVHEDWDRIGDDVTEKIYNPDFPSHSQQANQAGHGGGDFFTCYHFAEAIRNNRQPYFDVYRGLDMSLIAMQAWRSCLNDGKPFDIPNMRDENIRVQYEKDDWSPFPEDRKSGQPYSSITGEIKLSDEAIAYARSVWNEMGYNGE